MTTSSFSPSCTNFLSLMCSLDSSATHTLSLKTPRWPSSCEKGHTRLVHGLNRQAVLTWVNLQLGTLHSPPFRHGGMLGCEKVQWGLVQLGKNRHSIWPWCAALMAGDGCRPTHLRFLQAAPKLQTSLGSMVIPGGAAGD